MDRISAIRNIEDAIRDFESGDADLANTEQRVVTVLRTFATEFETDTGEESLDAWKAVGDERAHSELNMDKTTANDQLEKLRMKGDIYEPRGDVYRAT